ncbi:XrtA/PEP-CTERM system TPR-repeat protein PrsT [Candidatus Nitrotoga sp. 1052]|uniref:XrtA/PEP-CTERM system TPR-repeat protein PrsT n=1 Tax=Candidatus Nitrotoga sp. 1052 TaxID=2886964 RepID=UPI001EF3FAAC|nr:XrtA/PEP-CTERM system TPR-repeat protein PrsT [Candidatus Nitrotoga sp. 1052]CAH1084763.1 Lipoprotein [Candidatus Nitrotoga sp. 1052]
MPNINRPTLTVLMIAGAILFMGGMTACGKTETSETLVNEAKQYQLKGDNKAAIIQLKNALQKNPDDVEARYLLGTIYNETADSQSAEKELRKALSLGMNPTKVSPDLGKTLLMQGKFQMVLDEIKQISGKKESADISSLRGNAYLALGKGKEAKESFEQALKIKPDFPDALIGLARHSITEKNIDAATRFSELAVTKNPQNTDVLLFKGDLLRAQGKIEPALAAYDQVLKLQPDNSSAHINKAFLEIGTGKFDVAKADIDAARKLSPNNLIIIYAQALLDFRQGKHAAALESLQKVLSVAPEHMPSVLLTGAVQLALGSIPQAEQHLKKYLEKDPGNLYARKLMVSTLLKSRRTQNAIDVLSPALKIAQQDDIQLFALAGESYMQAGDYTKAAEYFTKASALAPKAAELHTALGLSKLALGENDRAVAEMETATALDTKSSQAGVLLVMTHLRLKEYDKALAAAKTLEKEQPDNPLAHNLKGAAYLGKNDSVAARASFEKALSIQPTNFTTVMNLVQLDLRDKKPEIAKKRLEAILEKNKKNSQVMTALADLALSQGQTKEATTWLENASKENPDALQPAMLLATHYLRIGEKQKALTLAQKLQGSNSSNPEALNILGQAQFVNGDKPAALATYNRLAAMKPDSAPAQFLIAAVHMAMQNQPAASDALKKALSLQPDYLEAQLALASLEASKGNYEQALAIARQIQKKSEKSPIGFVLEGDVLMAQKKPDLAVKAYEQAFTISKSGPLIVKLHSSLSHAGKGKEAGSRLTQWLKEHPADTETRIYLAGTYLAEKKNKEATEQYETILRQEPKYVPALNNLAWLYQQEKDPRALEYAEKANQLTPDNPAILDTLGWILVEQGNTSRGLPLLQKASSLAPKAAEIQYHLVLGLVKSGDKPKARKELEHLLDTKKNFSKIEEARALLKQL